MEYKNDFWFDSFIEEKAKEYRKELELIFNPNVYNWEKLKQFFSDKMEFRFDVKIENNEGNTSNSSKYLKNDLKYKVSEEKNKRIVEFEISEPKIEDISCDESKYLETYMEILKIVFYEAFSVIKANEFHGDEVDAANKLNEAFFNEMLLPNYEMGRAYLKFSSPKGTSFYEVDVNIVAKYFHVSPEMISVKLKKIHTRGYF